MPLLGGPVSAPVGHPLWCEPRWCTAGERLDGMHRSAVVPVGVLSLVRLDLVGLDALDPAGFACGLLTGESALVLARDLSALAGWWSR